MPTGDATGPMGTGPMTGRGTGYCAGYTMPGFMNPMPGRGEGRGFGRPGGGGQGGGRRGRHGRRHRFHAADQHLSTLSEAPEVIPLGPAPVPADELRTLNAQAGRLEQTLEQLRSRIAELELIMGNTADQAR